MRRMKLFPHGTNSISRIQTRFEWRGILTAVLIAGAIALVGTLDYWAEKERRDDWRRETRNG